MLKRAVSAAGDTLAARNPTRALARARTLLADQHFTRAAQLLGAAATAGLAEAQYALALRYLLGEGVAQSPAQAGQWFQRAAVAGHVGAQVKLAALHLAGLPEDMLTQAGLFAQSETRVDFAAAAHWAEQATQAGDAEARAMLAFILTAAPPPWRDEVRAERLYEDASAQGNAQAQLALGLLRLLQAQTTAGIALIKQAAQAGLPHAHDALGAIYENAIGTVQDFACSVAHYRIAAEAGMVRAMARYGLALLLGRGVTADGLTAETWLRRAALGGSEEAALRLGRLYAEPGDLPPNYTEAAMWFRRAAEAGNGEAAAVLGTLYLTGIGMSRDPAEAAMWFNRGAEAGDMVAAYNLSVCLATSVGVVKDDAKAAFWLHRAAASLPEAKYWYERLLAENSVP